MKTTSTGMKIPWVKVVVPCIAVLFLFFSNIQVCVAQDFGDGGGATGAAPPPDADTCDGIFLAYNFEGREKEYPRLKNASAQPYSFKASATVLNAGSYELKSWQIFIGFQHDEILVSADGAMVMDGDGLPLRVGNNGTHLVGYPQTDLKTAIETAGDPSQIMAKVEMKGTQFGVKKGDPMPKTIKLVNDGYKCPAPKRYRTYLFLSRETPCM
ncbi:hypothetical protein RJ639_047280 [Escallonia herrerae]|uniref:Uncharacterized protein n=1 Tax=Escallonia herrerae TaxID=1293975 RepID=A0AA88W8J2_9ASTE|nr:hypothetical protein RJ639_047280 [Escallonia herrerae]